MIVRSRTGWIGIDIGTSTLKMVQLSRSHNRLQIVGSAIVPRNATWSLQNHDTDLDRSFANEIRAAKSLDAGFRGKRAAVTLSMALCDIHSIDRPTVRSAERDRFIRQAIELTTQSSSANLQYDIWNAEDDPKSNTSPKSNVLTVARTWTDQVCHDISKSGWWCQTVDGLPLTLARALDLSGKYDKSTPTAVLDWGYSRATFCVVMNGSPVYVRCLKDCGLNQLIDTLTENLNISTEEAQYVLHEYGIAGNKSDESQAACDLIEEIIAVHLLRLEEEVNRTVAHLSGLRRTIIPKELVLFGGGATIKGLENHLTPRVSLKTRIWSLGDPSKNASEQTSPPSCLFGPAIALSALAWEQL